ncbi:hypothetical protein JYU34_005942, partial [Plutella xylostella]
ELEACQHKKAPNMRQATDQSARPAIPRTASRKLGKVAQPESGTRGPGYWLL